MAIETARSRRSCRRRRRVPRQRSWLPGGRQAARSSGACRCRGSAPGSDRLPASLGERTFGAPGPPAGRWPSGDQTQRMGRCLKGAAPRRWRCAAGFSLAPLLGARRRRLPQPRQPCSARTRGPLPPPRCRQRPRRCRSGSRRRHASSQQQRGECQRHQRQRQRHQRRHQRQRRRRRTVRQAAVGLSGSASVRRN
jgi:hypothetical protein